MPERFSVQARNDRKNKPFQRDAIVIATPAEGGRGNLYLGEGNTGYWLRRFAPLSELQRIGII